MIPTTSQERPDRNKIHRISPRSGTAFRLTSGEKLKIIDPEGQQVCDFVAFNQKDPGEFLSSGKTIDYAETLRISKGHVLYSNYDNPMCRIAEDTNGVNDFLLAPCSKGTMEHFYHITDKDVPTCFNNLTAALDSFGIDRSRIPVAFNVFMNVAVNNYQISVLPPASEPGDYLILEAEMDLIVAMTSCSAGLSNNFSYKPIDYMIITENATDSMLPNTLF